MAAGKGFSRVVLGVWRVTDWGMDASALAGFFSAAADLGVTSLDAADIYADYGCEPVVGAALAASPGLRDRLQLVTKCGIRLRSAKKPDVAVKHYDSSGAYVTAQVDESLRALRTDRLDLLLIHRPDHLMDADELAEAVVALKQAGKVLAFGVSNFTPSQVELLQSRLPFALAGNQIECSLLARAPLFDGTLDQCQRLRMMPMAWSPLGGGRLMNDGAGPGLASVLGQVASDTGLTTDQVALAWLMRHPSRIHPVIGSGRIERVRLAADAAAHGLDRQHWYRLLEAAQGHEVP